MQAVYQQLPIFFCEVLNDFLKEAKVVFVSICVFEVFIHLAEKNFAISHFSCAPYRGMALDVMKPTSFKVTGKFVAVIFGFVYLFFFLSSCHI